VDFLCLPPQDASLSNFPYPLSCAQLLDKQDGDEVVPFKNIVYDLWANLPPAATEESMAMTDVSSSEVMDTEHDPNLH